MVKINLTPPQFTITVGSLDITNLVQQISIRQGAIAIGSPIVWEGSITIAKTIDWEGESLDDFVNPTRWARGKYAVSFSIAGTLFATLRISGYAYNEDTESAQINVTQLLGLLDYRTPAEDYRVFGDNPLYMARTSIVKTLLQQAGITSVNLSGYGEPQSVVYQNTGDIVFANGMMLGTDRVNESYIGLAQTIMGEQGYWLYHLPNETVAVKKLNFDATKGFQRSRAECVEFNRNPQRGIVPTLYRVIGGGEKLERIVGLADAVNEVEKIYGLVKTWRTEDTRLEDAGLRIDYFYEEKYGLIDTVTTEIITETATFIHVKKTGVRDYLYLIDFISKKPNNYRDVKIYEINEYSYYDYQGRLVRTVRQKDGIAYGSFPDSEYKYSPYGLEWIKKLEYNETVYSSDPRAFNEYIPRAESFSTYFRNDPNAMAIKLETTGQTIVFDDGEVEIVSDTETVRLTGSLFPSISVTFKYEKKLYKLLYVETQKVVETWLPKDPRAVNSTTLYKRKTYGINPSLPFGSVISTATDDVSDANQYTQLVLLNDFSEDTDDVSPPSWGTRSPLFPRTEANVFAEVVNRYPGSDVTTASEQPFEYSAKTLLTDSDASRLASILGKLEVGRAFGYEVVLSLREATEFIANPTPLQTAWIHNRAFLLDSASLVFDGTEAEISWETCTTKTLNPVVPEPGGTDAPVETDYLPVEVPIVLVIEIQTTMAVNLTGIQGVDVTAISIDGNGDVETVAGYVQGGNQFAQILVDNSGSVVVSASGNVVTTADDPYGEATWNEIVTVGGDVVSIDGQVVVIS